MSKKKHLFFGSATAIVTPFSRGQIDYLALGKMIDFQLENGTDALVILGTTGEASTIYENERSELIAFARRKTDGKIPLIVGTGSNATSVAVRYSKSAESLGADGCLVVTPYYNKASAKGLTEHYREIAKSVKIPIILYNVPSRTGVKIPMEVYRSLAKISNIVGVKEASGDLGYLTELIYNHKEDFDIYTGCDELILPTLALGGQGVISVVSNIMPKEVKALCSAYKNGNTKEARALQLYLSPLIKELFAEVNPIPVKGALYKMGMCENEYRLPLCPSARGKEIEEILGKYNLITAPHSY